MEDFTKVDTKLIVFIVIISVVLIPLFITAFFWHQNNPKANAASYWRHFDDAVHFRSLPQYQREE